MSFRSAGRYILQLVLWSSVQQSVGLQVSLGFRQIHQKPTLNDVLFTSNERINIRNCGNIFESQHPREQSGDKGRWDSNNLAPKLQIVFILRHAISSTVTVLSS
jgi:hypothetical protein